MVKHRTKECQSSKVNESFNVVDGGTSEAVKVDQAARALTGMSTMTSSVSSIRLRSIDSPCGAKRCSTQDVTMECKRQRQLLTKPTELVDDRAAEPCIPCPVCLVRLEFLPLVLDTDLLSKPVRSPTLVKSMKAHSIRFHPDEPLWNALLNPNSESYNIQKIVNMNCDKEAAMALVEQSLAIAARSLDIPKHNEWANSWSRVQALTLARIGVASESATW